MSVNRAHFSAEQFQKIAGSKVFFGHQSVGDNIIQGLRDLIAADPRLQLNIVHSDGTTLLAGPALVEFYVGRNGDPQSKDTAFAAILDSALGSQGGLAMYKYCYVDMDISTNVQQMFEHYRQANRTLKAKYPSLIFIPVTMPLTTVEPAWKAAVKTAMGRTTARDVNEKRNKFNELIRQTYQGTDPIFDLAEAESTHADGSRSFFTRDGRKVYTLAPEYTSDGGHLNEAGRRAAAEKLLLVLAGS
jgi:lysophospholipase L1-like esterase